MDRSSKIVQVSIIGIIVNVLLVGFKAFVGFLSGSVAIIMDAVNNLSDALSSVITIIGTKLAGKKPDKKHPYGYGRIEYISAILVSIIVVLAGLTSFKESFDKIIHPSKANYTVVTLVIIAAAFVVKLVLGRYVKAQGEKYNSESLVASGKDAMFDSVISFSTLVAAGVSMIAGLSIEGYLGIVISIIILKAGLEILLEGLGDIIGARIEPEFAKEIKAYVSEFEGVNGAYDLILHRYGPEKIIGSIHVEVPDEFSAREIHALTRKIMDSVYEKYQIIITVGIYSANTDNGQSTVFKNYLKTISDADPMIIQTHGLYFDEEKSRVYFDMVLDFNVHNRFDLRDEVAAKMK